MGDQAVLGRSFFIAEPIVIAVDGFAVNRGPGQVDALENLLQGQILAAQDIALSTASLFQGGCVS